MNHLDDNASEDGQQRPVWPHGVFAGVYGHHLVGISTDAGNYPMDIVVPTSFLSAVINENPTLCSTANYAGMVWLKVNPNFSNVEKLVNDYTGINIKGIKSLFFLLSNDNFNNVLGPIIRRYYSSKLNAKRKL